MASEKFDEVDSVHTAVAEKSTVYRFQDPWFATAWDSLRLFGIQMLCSGGSGAVAKTLVAPLDRVKILLQVQQMSNVPSELQYKTGWDALRRIPTREGGLWALYRGNGANVVRLVPDVAFKFAVHDQFKIMFAPVDGAPLGISEKLAAGAAAGLMRCLLLHPLDLCRTRITTDQSPSGPHRTYPTIRHCVYDTVRREGVGGLYKGVLASGLSVAPYLSISFTVYDELKDMLPDDHLSRSQWWFPVAKIGCGAAAAAIAQTTVYPLDTVRRRMQLNGALGQSVTYRGYIHCIASMVGSEGLRSFYRGSLVNVVRVVPGAAVQFVAYDLLRTGVQMLDPASGLSSPL